MTSNINILSSYLKKKREQLLLRLRKDLFVNQLQEFSILQRVPFHKKKLRKVRISFLSSQKENFSLTDNNWKPSNSFIHLPSLVL